MFCRHTLCSAPARTDSSTHGLCSNRKTSTQRDFGIRILIWDTAFFPLFLQPAEFWAALQFYFSFSCLSIDFSNQKSCPLKMNRNISSSVLFIESLVMSTPSAVTKRKATLPNSISNQLGITLMESI